MPMLIMSPLRISVLLTWFCSITPSAACACRLQWVSIDPEQAEPAETYIGKWAGFELRFHNDKTSGQVDVFPEPPVILMQLDTRAECSITAGGIWVRKHVYASADGNMLMLHEYSGSNDELVFYDPRTCRKRAVVDVSNSRWVLGDDGGLVVSPATAGQPVRISLDRMCLPVKSSSSLIHR